MEALIETRIADLIARARDGDGEAFALLVEPHLSDALRVARVILGDSDDAADVVQDALLSAWRALGTLRNPPAFGAWFRRHVVRAAWRSAKRRRHTDAIEDRISAAGDIERDVAKRILLRAFSRLSADDRIILTLHYHLGLPSQETAELLNIPKGTVKSRVHHSLRRLRAAYDAEERA